MFTVNQRTTRIPAQLLSARLFHLRSAAITEQSRVLADEPPPVRVKHLGSCASAEPRAGASLSWREGRCARAPRATPHLARATFTVEVWLTRMSPKLRAISESEDARSALRPALRCGATRRERDRLTETQRDEADRPQKRCSHGESGFLLHVSVKIHIRPRALRPAASSNGNFSKSFFTQKFKSSTERPPVELKTSFLHLSRETVR